jgi:hypothetical protein
MLAWVLNLTYTISKRALTIPINPFFLTSMLLVCIAICICEDSISVVLRVGLGVSVGVAVGLGIEVDVGNTEQVPPPSTILIRPVQQTWLQLRYLASEKQTNKYK